MFDVCLIADTGRWEDQWSYVLSHWSARNIYILGEVNTAVKPFREAIFIDSCEELPNIPIVALQADNARFVPGTVPLPNFTHPDECVYLFGNDHTHLCDDQLGTRVPEHVVFIPSDTHDEMYSWIAGAIAFYDRAVRHG